MSARDAFATHWQGLLDAIAACAPHGGMPPIVLSSASDLPDVQALAGEGNGARGSTALSFVQGPPGRIVSLAVGLRAALHDTPLVVVMNADSVTLGTNHLIHAARRNYRMTLLLLRSDLTRSLMPDALDRAGWSLPEEQRALETPARPLDWAAAMGAAFVARATLRDPAGLATLLREAMATRGLSVVGLVDDADLPIGVLKRSPATEYFDAYRAWRDGIATGTAMILRGASRNCADTSPTVTSPVIIAHTAASPAITSSGGAAPSHLPRCEIRIAGLGGHGVKLAGTVLSEAAGLDEGRWATQRGEYGSATRGGPSMVDVVIGSDPISYPAADHPHVMVALTERSAQHYAGAVRPGGWLVVDADEVRHRPPGVLVVAITALAREYTGKPLAAGMVAAGCVAALTGAVTLDCLRARIALHLPAGAAAGNIAACDAGYRAARAALEESTEHG